MTYFGVEEEFCIIDKDSYKLKNSIYEFLNRIPSKIYKEYIKSDLHECILEISTRIHSHIQECFIELTELRSLLKKIAGDMGCCLISSGVHPFSPASEAKLIYNPRYERLTEMGGLLAEGVHFGMHLHIGVDDEVDRIRVLNMMRYFIPEIIAVSVNSPCYEGILTGYQSTRLMRYDPTPTVGIPEKLGNCNDFENYITRMNKYGVEEPRDVYWDIRLRPELKTLEFRVMDSQIDANSTIMIVSFILLLFKYLNQFNRVEELEKEIQLPDEEELKKTDLLQKSLVLKVNLL
jgi:carboxylate-amine ligase